MGTRLRRELSSLHVQITAALSIGYGCRWQMHKSLKDLDLLNVSKQWIFFVAVGQDQTGPDSTEAGLSY